jgi:hypothetical protein
MRSNEFQCRSGACNRAARNEHPGDTDLTSAFDDLITVVIEAVMDEVDANVDQWRGSFQS